MEFVSPPPSPPPSSPLTPTVIASPNGVVLSQGTTSVSVEPNDITFSIQSNPSLFLSEKGIVGINQSHPTKQLHVTPGTVKIDGNTSMIGFNDGYSSIQYNNAVLPNSYQTRTLPSNGLGVYGMVDGMFGTYHPVMGVKPLLNWNSAGKVGIGTKPTQSDFIVQGDMNMTEQLSAKDISVPILYNSNSSLYSDRIVCQTTATFQTLSNTTSCVWNSDVSIPLLSSPLSSCTSSNAVLSSLAGTSGQLQSVQCSLSGSSLASGYTLYHDMNVSGLTNCSSLFFSSGVLGNTTILKDMRVTQGLVSGMTYLSTVATIGLNAILRYPISQSQTATVSVDDGIFSTGPLLTGSSYHSALKLWCDSNGYIDSTGGLIIRENNGFGSLSSIVHLTATSFGIGGSPSGIVQVNIGGDGKTIFSAMGYDNYLWYSSVLFGTDTDGISIGYLQSISSGIICCGGRTAGPNDLSVHAKKFTFNVSPTPRTITSTLYIHSNGAVGIGTVSPVSLMDVYGKVFIRGEKSNVSFQGITAGQAGSYYLNGYLSSSNTQYDMGGMKWLDTTYGTNVQSSLVWYTRYHNTVSEHARLSTRNGNTELQLTSSSYHLRMMKENYGTMFYNNDTNTCLLISSGNSYGAAGSLQPFCVSNSTGLLTSQHGQALSGGTKTYGCTIANSGTTVVSGMTTLSSISLNQSTVSNGLTVDTITMISNLTCSGSASFAKNVAVNPGKTIRPYYTVSFSGSPLLLNNSSTLYSRGYGSFSIPTSQYAYLSLNWENGYTTNGGTSPIVNSVLGTNTAYYQVKYTGMYSFTVSLYGGNSGKVTCFMAKSTGNGINVSEPYLLSGATEHRKINLSWTGIVMDTDKIVIGLYVNSGTFIPGFRSRLTITNLQRVN